MRAAIFLVILFLIGASTAEAFSASERPRVYGIYMNMEINPASQDYLISNLKIAEDNGYHYFILVLTTPGGDSNSMLNMISAIDQYENNYNGTFIVYGVSPGVFSAGCILSEAADYVDLQNGSSFGGASPIFSEPEPTYVVQKIMGAYSELVSSEAVLHHRNGTAAGMMVSADVNRTEGGLTYTWQKAIALRVVNGYAVNITQLLHKLSSMGIIPSQATFLLVGPSLADQFRYELSNSTLDALLLDLGFFAVLVDLYHPTGVLTVVGLTSLVLGLYGMGVVGASPIAILLFALAGALMFLELKAGHGLFAASGVVISLVALFMIYGEVIIPSVHGAPSAPGYFSTKPIYTLLTGIEFGVLAAALGLAVLYLDKVREALKTKPKLMDNERLVGMIGRASVDFENGKGTVIVRSEEWSAISDDLIRKGDRVKVLAVNGIILKVKKEADDL